MNNQKKSRKVLFIATVLTIIALASVLFVYAAVTLFSVTGGNVTVLGVTTGTIEYNTAKDGSGTWSQTLTTNVTWYAELVIGSSSSYTGPVTVTFQLESYATGSLQPEGTAVVTSVVSLVGGPQTIYAATDNVLADAQNWALIATSGGTYEITATVASAP